MIARRIYAFYLGDLDRANTRSHGIINYSLGLAGALATALDADERLVLLTNPRISDELEIPSAVTGEVVLADMPVPSSGTSRLLNDQARSTRLALAYGAHLIHYPKGFVPRHVQRGLSLVATIHDDIPCRYVEGEFGNQGGATNRLKNRYFASAIAYSVRRSDVVVTDSQFTSDVLIARFPSARQKVLRAGIGLPRLAAIPSDACPFDTRNGFVIHLSSRLPHKRSAEAIRWTCDYLATKRPDLRLVLVGAPPPEAVVGDGSLIDVAPSPLSSEALFSSIAHARALIVNSSIEGFGLPPCEAFLAGTPAVWPRAGSLPEVLAEFPGAFDAGDQASFECALDSALALNESVLSELARIMGERHRWAATAESVLGAYRHLTAAR